MTSATVICRSCGTEPTEGARFCACCGERLIAATDAAEYKQVTVLFADVARSMDIAAALELERLREVMTKLVERSAAVALRYGGSVEYNGDGVMALFGAPVSLEDHAIRACLAALDIQGEARRGGARATPPHGGGGVSDDFPLARMYAGLRTLRLADGPDEVHRRQVARTELARYEA